METSIERLFDHFNSVGARYISQFGVAVSADDWDGARSLVDRVSRLAVTSSITNLINSSRNSLRQFVDKVVGETDSEPLKFLVGATVCGMGGVAFAGTSIVAVKVVAVLLLLWGFLTAYSALQNIGLRQILGLQAHLGNGA